MDLNCSSFRLIFRKQALCFALHAKPSAQKKDAPRIRDAPTDFRFEKTREKPAPPQSGREASETYPDTLYAVVRFRLCVITIASVHKI
ncbi:MAG: hypothetical protein DBY36_01245 [Clostridiales bacterium]|nr:MAG: hypothetical protein DBY36_01245 [Clostridiales bacterium]